MKKISNVKTELQKTFKEIYKYIYNVKPLDWDEIIFTEEEFNHILKISEKKNNGEDVTFDIGFKYFRNNKINLEKGVFVPQYDTEEIIEPLLALGINSGRVLEVGAGTGAISISVAKETKLIVDAIDINKNAISLAKENAKQNGVKINFINQNVFEYDPEVKYDILISNPPYIKDGDEEVEEWVKTNQPYEALYAENDGYMFYQHLIINNKRYLKENGILIFEIGHKQAKAIKLIAENSGARSIKVIRDIDNKNDRFIVVNM